MITSAVAKVTSRAALTRLASWIQTRWPLFQHDHTARKIVRAITYRLQAKVVK